MRNLYIIGTLLASLFIASGCSAIASKVAEPVLSLASEDATATLAWIDGQVEAGNLSETDATLAKACPEAVLALNELRAVIANAEAPDGFKGLIYLGTVKKYGGGERDLVVRSITQTAASCLPLVSYDRLLYLML